MQVTPIDLEREFLALKARSEAAGRRAQEARDEQLRAEGAAVVVREIIDRMAAPEPPEEPDKPARKKVPSPRKGGAANGGRGGAAGTRRKSGGSTAA